MRGRVRGSAESAADIDGFIRSALEPLERRPPPHSDIRRIGSTMTDADEDPLAVYVDALRQPAVEIAPRARRATMVMPMRPRQTTLLMIDRPSALSPATPPMAMVPRARKAPIAEPPLPGRFRGAAPILLFVFGAGLFVSGATVFVLTLF
jgi:hypothetical protein